jgi:hypothetical protein
MKLKLNGSLIAGIILAVATLYYWIALRHTPFVTMPLLYRFTFRLFPLADILWTIAAGGLLYRGIHQARSQ